MQRHQARKHRDGNDVAVRGFTLTNRGFDFASEGSTRSAGFFSLFSSFDHVCANAFLPFREATWPLVLLPCQQRASPPVIAGAISLIRARALFGFGHTCLGPLTYRAHFPISMPPLSQGVDCNSSREIKSWNATFFG